MSEPPDREDDGGPRSRTQFAIGAVLLVLALVIWLDALKLPAPSIVGVGPSAAMRLMALIVAVVAFAHWISAWRQRSRLPAARASEPPPTHGTYAPLAWVLGALLGLIAILEIGGGFVLGSTWLFVGTARGFGERLSAKSIAIGFGLSAAVYLFFTKSLSLGLPAGPLERLLG